MFLIPECLLASYVLSDGVEITLALESVYLSPNIGPATSQQGLGAPVSLSGDHVPQPEKATRDNTVHPLGLW